MHHCLSAYIYLMYALTAIWARLVTPTSDRTYRQQGSYAIEMRTHYGSRRNDDYNFT